MKRRLFIGKKPLNKSFKSNSLVKQRNKAKANKEANCGRQLEEPGVGYSKQGRRLFTWKNLSSFPSSFNIAL